MVFAVSAMNMAGKELSPQAKAVADRLADIVDDKGWKPSEIAARLGYERTIVTKYVNATQKVSDQFLRKFEEGYRVSRNYLLKGDGPIYLSNTSTDNATDAESKKSVRPRQYRDLNDQVRDPMADYNGPTDFNISNQRSGSKPNMWIVPVKAQAGFLRGFEGRTFANQIQRIAWPLVSGECFCYEVEGVSMFPKYHPNSWVICTILEDWNWLKRDRNYVFQTFDGLYLKQFDRIDENFVYLKSLNLDTPPIAPVPISELRIIYAIEGIYNKE